MAAASVAGSMNGFLIAWITINKLGLAKNMVIMEFMICVLLIHSVFALVGARSKQASWLVCFLTCDVIFSGVDIALITVMARAGVPTHCAGLTRTDFEPEDHPENPHPGYSTVRFSNEAGDAKGELDRFCAFERTTYFIAVGLIFTFMLSIVLAVLAICRSHYTKNTRVTELLDSLERNKEKEQEQFSPLLATPTTLAPPPPLSEGIITRHTSVRSVSTSGHTNIPVPNPYRTTSVVSRRPVPNRALTSLSVISNHSIDGLVTRDSQLQGQDVRYSADAALVADGMQHQGPQQQQDYRPISHPAYSHQDTTRHGMPMLMEEEFNHQESALVADGMHHHRPMYQQQAQHQGQQPFTPPSTGDEESAALVSDGMRPTSTLPPYTPGRLRMPGQRRTRRTA